VYREKFRIFVAWAEPDPKTNNVFRILGYSWTILRTAYRKQFYPKPMVPMESRVSEGVPLLVWRIGDQVFGGYRPLKGYLLGPGDLRQEHRSILLRFCKNL